MALTLHAALVPQWLQIIGSVEGLVDKAEQWCSEKGLPAEDVIGACLAEDMLPFAYQVKSCWAHSAYAIERAQHGRFEPEMAPPPSDFAGLRTKLAQARSGLETLDPALLDSIADNPMVFAIGDKLRLDFTVQNFLLGFSQPNLFFHASTAYGILRNKGLPIGKVDFLGRMPLSA